MSTHTVSILELTSACIDLAIKAGEEIRKVAASGDLDVIGKDKDGHTTKQTTAEQVLAGEDAVTKADIFAQQLIEGSLVKHFPGLRVVGEEEIDSKDFKVVDVNKLKFKGLKVPDNYKVDIPIDEITVYVDPLDATKEFVLGNKYCTITLIGITVGTRPVAGVMCQPFEGPHGRLVWAITGVSAEDTQTNDSKNILKVLPKTPYRSPDNNDWNLVTTRLHNTPAVEDAIAKLKPKNVIRVGGAGYKVLTLLEGDAELYMYPTGGTKKWDTCAPDAILTHFGGKMTDGLGNLINYDHKLTHHNKNGLMASRIAKDHEKFVERLNPKKN